MLLLIKISATVCFAQPPKQVSVGQYILKLALQVNFVYQLGLVIIRHHKHVHRIVNCIEQLTVIKNAF